MMGRRISFLIDKVQYSDLIATNLLAFLVWVSKIIVYNSYSLENFFQNFLTFAQKFWCICKFSRILYFLLHSEFYWVFKSIKNKKKVLKNTKKFYKILFETIVFKTSFLVPKVQFEIFVFPFLSTPCFPDLWC